LDDSPRKKKPDRAGLARETNAHIRQLAKALRDERPIGFFCECGCMAIVLATLLEYDSHGGAWLEGHKPHGGAWLEGHKPT
jgi:hypothetical protein